jgi:hypothetical protein
MASGVLGQVSLAATTYTTVYTVPSQTLSYANVNIANRNTTNVSVRVAITTGATPTTAQFIEYDVDIAPNGVLERTGLVLDIGKQVVVYSDTANVSVGVYGVEQLVS